jgi:hypothetical protein
MKKAKNILVSVLKVLWPVKNVICNLKGKIKKCMRIIALENIKFAKNVIMRY